MSRLAQIQIPDISRERGLPHLESPLSEGALQVFLARYRTMFQDVKHCPLSQGFIHDEYLCTVLHKDSHILQSEGGMSRAISLRRCHRAYAYWNNIRSMEKATRRTVECDERLPECPQLFLNRCQSHGAMQCRFLSTSARNAGTNSKLWSTDLKRPRAQSVKAKSCGRN